MSGPLVFVVHCAANHAYGRALAAALAPLPTVPVALPLPGETPLRLGSGSASVVVWTPKLLADHTVVELLEALGQGNFVLCRLGNPSVPERLVATPRIQATGDPVGDAEKLRPFIERFGSEPPMAAAGRGGRLDGVQRGERTMAVRSALGLVGTIAVAGAAVPFVSGRMVSVAAVHSPPANTLATIETDEVTEATQAEASLSTGRADEAQPGGLNVPRSSDGRPEPLPIAERVGDADRTELQLGGTTEMRLEELLVGYTEDHRDEAQLESVGPIVPDPKQTVSIDERRTKDSAVNAAEQSYQLKTR